MVYANDFYAATDSDTLERAIQHRTADGIVIIPPRQSDVDPDRTYWLLDRAVCIPSDTTVILENCMIKLSDRCRDNFFRTANCGLGIADPAKIRNVHLKGVGRCVLMGADHPRATGDGTKILACPCPKKPEDLCRLADWIPEERRKSGNLDFWDCHDHSYGTDANNPNESHYGDWRGIGVLFANAEHFSIENLTIIESHGWGISLEACAYGRVEKIDFDAKMEREIDGLLQNTENQDGIDLRNGCHDIVVTDITGGTGDDLIALTAIASPHALPGGSLRTTHVMHNAWTRRERDIYNIIIRNVIGRCQSGVCCLIRLLPAEAQIRNVVIDNVVDNSPADCTTGIALLLGEPDGAYGRNLPDSIQNLTVSNLVSACRRTVAVEGYLNHAAFTNIINRGEEPYVFFVARPGGMKNTLLSNIQTAGDQIIRQNQ